MSENLQYRAADFEWDVISIFHQINRVEWKPDYVVGILRGGAVPAVALSHKFNVPMITINYSTRDHQVGKSTNFFELVTMLDHKKNVLLVDDIIDSGNTIADLCVKLQFQYGANPKYLKIASLIYNPSNGLVVPDFFGMKLDRATDSRWVDFFWER